jgi:hypothetical protein
MRMNSGQYPSPPGMILSHYAVGFIVYTLCDFAWILPLPTERCGEGEESTGVATAASGTTTINSYDAANT